MLRFLAIAAVAIAWAGSAQAGPSSFQRSCSDIRIEFANDQVTISASCRDKAGQSQPADFPLSGYHNIDGRLVFDGRGKGTFHRSCANDKLDVKPDRVVFSSDCKTRNQSVRRTSIEIQDIQNIDGRLVRMGQSAPPPSVAAAPVPSGPGARPPARGKSFYVNTEGADVPGLCIDIAGGQLRAGTPIMLWECHRQAPQRFGLNPNAGLVFVTAVQNLCVDGRPQEQLRLVNCNAVSTRWRYDQRSNTIRSDNGMCWDIRAGNVPANIRQRAQVIAFPCHNKVNQQFVLND